MESFDRAAEYYDAQFTNTCIGIAQRERVWKIVNSLTQSDKQNVLEINCGTGKDASIWHQKGHEILATDGSQKMIDVAQQKYPKIQFKQLDINNIKDLDSSYSLVFSNFGGLNCLSPEELKSFFTKVNSKLERNGSLYLVIMGKKCLWDRFFMILKRNWKDRNRRNTTEGIPVNVDGETVTTWYYSPKDIAQLSAEYFKVSKRKPIGLFIPPSYLSKTFEKRRFLLAILKSMDKLLSFSFLSNHADHYFIHLTKKTQ